jgi:hypothetical protein
LCPAADLEFFSQIGDTALIQAAFEGHTDCVRLLVEVGADMEAKDNVCDSHLFFFYFVYRIARFISASAFDRPSFVT